MRKITLLACLASAAFVVTGALAAAKPQLPVAFQRPMRADDRIPSSASTSPKDAPARLVYRTAHDGATWKLYALATEERVDGRPMPVLCLLLMRGTADEGTECASGYYDDQGNRVFVTADPGSIFYDDVTIGRASMILGIAADAAARVTVTTVDGRSEPIQLSADHGFVRFCDNPGGCACRLTAIQAFAPDGRRLATVTSLHDATCRATH